MQIQLVFIQDAIRNAGEDIDPHRHTCHELVYYLSGCGVSMVASSRTHEKPLAHAYHEGQFLVIPPNCSHWESHETDTRVVFIGFRASGLPGDIREGLITDDHGIVLHGLLRMAAEYKHRRTLFEEKLKVGLADLLLDVIRMHADTPTSACNMDMVDRYMREHAGQEIDFHQLAQMSGYSYHRFRHLFKQQVGLSPLQHLLQIRLSQACGLLLQTRLSISDISGMTGFSSESRFCSLFRKRYGCTPGSWRRGR